MYIANIDNFMDNYNTLQYFLDDYPKTLFPLQTNKIIIERKSEEISDYIFQKVLNSEEKEHFFLPQVKCHSSKSGFHLRRTFKLDPVAEFFIYDLIYRNRSSFRDNFNPSRLSFGYRFFEGKVVYPRESYGNFKFKISEAKQNYKYGLKFDIASYFNSMYHHDITAWFSESEREENDVQALGQFLREINNGRSIDCLPHGIHPCKVIGAEFLKFIDNSYQIKSELLLRFMDDFYIFSNEQKALDEDIITIQKMIGDKGLSINAAKTQYIYSEDYEEKNIDDIKVNLLQIRRNTIEVSGEIEEEANIEELNKEQVEYLIHLLKEHDISEADVELILVLLRDHENDVFVKIGYFLNKFPSVTRNFYNFCNHVKDLEELSKLICKLLKENLNFTEDQLFWLAKIAEDILSETNYYGEILHLIYDHVNSTIISKAKILEIPENRFSMGDLRREHLRVGKSDWLAWASAIGCRNETKIKRNHELSYYSKISKINNIIGEIVRDF